MTIALSRTQFPSRYIPIRYRLLGGGLVITLLSLVMIFQTAHAYTTAYQHFYDIALESSVKVDASISALQHLASINKYAADLIGYTQQTDQQQALTSIYSEFQSFRDQMFDIRKGLSKPEEFAAYTQSEQAIYNQYWRQMNTLIDAQANQDKAAAIDAFNHADQVFEEKIIPSMTELEQLNYTAMLDAKAGASAAIGLNTVIVGIFGIGAALFISVFSFWLRGKIRRYFTPGIDLAAVLAWIFSFIIVFQLASLPDQLRVMVQDSYYSVTASARVIADANRANVTESAALNDPAHASQWQQHFDQYVHLVTLRMCGQQDCLSHPFSQGKADTVDPVVAQIAKAISPEDSNAIDKVIPLLGNITFTGEVTTLEQARLAYLDYLQIDQQTRLLLANNQLEDAIQLNTGRSPGQSDEAFFRFVNFMQQEEAINRAVFDAVWADQEQALPTAQLVYGTLGFTLVILLSGLGVYHRFREL